MVRALWPAAVGKAIAAHTARLRMVRSKLIVEVEDAIWQRQLHTLSYQILGRLQTLSGSKNVTEIEFRIGVPRREPQRAETAQPALTIDEADRIKDPTLRRIYQRSRQRALA